MPGVFMRRLHILVTMTQSILGENVAVIVSACLVVVVGGQDLTQSFHAQPKDLL